jgi:hypothetical protein
MGIGEAAARAAILPAQPPRADTSVHGRGVRCDGMTARAPPGTAGLSPVLLHN